jgi:hypothetical protein
MNARKVANFLFLRSAFTQRNFTSLLLVAIFFAVYLLSGGTISTSIPRLPDSTAFGNIPVDPATGVQSSAASSQPQKVDKDAALEVLGIKPSEDRVAREQSVNQRGRLFSADEAKDSEKIDKNGLIAGAPEYRSDENKLRRYEKKPGDSLTAIEERLNIRRH